MNSYPSDLLDNKRERVMIIHVKEQKSLSGAYSELKDEVLKASKDVSEVFSHKDSSKSSDSTKVQKEKRKKKLTKAKTVYSFALPLPLDLTDSQSHDWETTSGIIGKLGKKIMDTSISDISINQAMGELSAKTGTRKPLVDPGYFQDYNGSQPRTFSFSWDLIPNNEKESKEIQEILYHIKKYTLPTSTINGISLQAPYVFDIVVGNKKIQQILNLNNVVCTGVNVTFAAEGSLQMFSDGMPKYIKLEMSFIERIVMTADMY